MRSIAVPIGVIVALWVAAFAVAWFGTGCNWVPGRTPANADASDAAVVQVDGGTCAHPSDLPLCACEVLTSFGCHEAEPTATGESCVDGSRSRLASKVGRDVELADIVCVVQGGPIERLREQCSVCR